MVVLAIKHTHAHARRLAAGSVETAMRDRTLTYPALLTNNDDDKLNLDDDVSLHSTARSRSVVLVRR